jgi:hypothetical protein
VAARYMQQSTVENYVCITVIVYDRSFAPTTMVLPGRRYALKNCANTFNICNNISLWNEIYTLIPSVSESVSVAPSSTGVVVLLVEEEEKPSVSSGPVTSSKANPEFIN